MTSEERGALLVGLLSGGDVGRFSPLAQLELEAILALAEKPRGKRIAALREALLAPLQHAELVHPSWLDGEDVGSAEPSVARWLAQRARGTLVDMPARLASAEQIEITLVELGRHRLALALRAVPAAAQAQVLARLGERQAEELLAELRAPGGAGEIGGAVRELAELVAASGPALLFHAGARRLAPALEGDLARQLAQRLPRERGLVVLDERERAVAAGTKPSPEAEARLRTLFS